MKKKVLPTIIQVFFLLLISLSCNQSKFTTEPREEVSFLRGPYNFDFFRRHNDSYRYSAGFHFHHGAQHDILQLEPLNERKRTDSVFDFKVMDMVINKEIPVEPSMEYFGPYVGRMAFKLYRTIDWTHMHHEQTYDIMSENTIPWEMKKEWTDRAVEYYLEQNPGVAFSVAPLDITMRRAAVMMKPYFTYYRNFYPRSNGDAWVAHWWHPAIYEAMMLAGNGQKQEELIDATNKLMNEKVFFDRPQRMLLSREIMPRYSRLSPESANIFDNLHMLHGIAFDILAYEGWNEQQKRDEIYRVIEALKYQKGDEAYIRKFKNPEPDIDPRNYDDWVKGFDGEMNRIMIEMMEEMQPMMMPGITESKKQEIMEQFKMKLMQDMQPGEIEGSLHDALIKIYPQMTMEKESMEPGKTAQKMVDTMIEGWKKKYADMPDIAPYPMEKETLTNK